MSEDELINEARKHEKMIMNFFLQSGLSYHESEDLLQEVYLRLWRYRSRYVETAKLSTFLFLIARQVQIDAIRANMRRDCREKTWSDAKQETQAPASMARMDVLWALSRLSENLREVVILGVMQDLPYAEVAEILAIPVGTVKSRMFNALRKLKEIFDEQGLGRNNK